MSYSIETSQDFFIIDNQIIDLDTSQVVGLTDWLGRAFFEEDFQE